MGALPPYSSLKIDANCAQGRLQPRFPSVVLRVDGIDPLLTPDEVATALDSSPLSLEPGQQFLAEQYFQGYLGIERTSATSPPGPFGQKTMSNIRFVAQNKNALVHVADCIATGKIETILKNLTMDHASEQGSTGV
jgi:hypothetical protein